jgi:hypothetical protein
MVAAVLVGLFSGCIQRSLQRLPPRFRLPGWGLAFLPLLTPALLPGYAYREWVLSETFLNRPWLTEAFTSSLIVLRMLPVGAATLACLPPSPVSPTAWHLAAMSLPADAGLLRRIRRRAPLFWHGPVRRAACPFTVVFLVAFQEFELPSLLHRPSWTVWLFDSQVGGEQWSRLASACVVPVLIQLGVGFLAIWSVGGTPRGTIAQSANRYAVGRYGVSRYGVDKYAVGQYAVGRYGAISNGVSRYGDPAWCIAILTLAVVGILLGPLWRLRPGLPEAVAQLVTDGPRILGWLREIGASLGVSAAGCGMAFFLVHSGSQQTKPGLVRALTGGAVSVFAAVGLCGSLPIALAVGAFCRSVLPPQISQSLLPWFFGVVLFALPRLVVLAWVWRRWLTADAVGVMLKESPFRDVRVRQANIAWTNGGAARWLSAAAVVLVIAFDLTLASILAPVGVVAAPSRLYNLMHYGRTTVLTAMTVVAIVVPGVLLLLGLWGRRMVARWLIP